LRLSPSYPFFIWEKYHRKDGTIHQR
jgi:hypothetical protein